MCLCVCAFPERVDCRGVADATLCHPVMFALMGCRAQIATLPWKEGPVLHK